MKLIINYEAKYDMYPFMSYLIRCFKDRLDDLLDENKLKIYDLYLHENILFTPEHKNITYKSILYSLSNKMKIRKTQNGYEIFIDPNAYVDGTNIKIEPLCKLLNYGNQELPPYPIIEIIFNDLADRINEYYILYKYLRRV